MKFLSFIIFINLSMLSNLIHANESTCNNLKNSIISAQYTSMPEKDKFDQFGLEFYGSTDEEENFVYENALIVERVNTSAINELLDVNDEIIKINDQDINDLFSNNSLIETTNIIDNFFDKNNKLTIEVKKYLTEAIIKYDIFKQISDYPIEVRIDFTLEDITFINIKDNTYSAKYNFAYQWKDNRLKKYFNNSDIIFCKFSRINENDNLYKSLWKPEIIESNKIDNIDTYDSFQYADILIEEIDGEVYILVEVFNNAKFNNPFDLREFPFDIQNFDFRFYTTDFDTDVRLLSWWDKEALSTSHNYALSTIEHPEWKFLNIETYVYPELYSGGEYFNNYVFSLSAERHKAYYFTKVIIPIFIILIICWSVFWISGIQLESRLTVTSVSFLALIAYNYVVEDDLPKIGYSTILDYIILSSYVFAGLATILTVYSYTNCKKNGYEFCNVDYLARYLGPIIYFFVNIALIVWGLQSMSAGEFVGRFL